MSTPNIKELCAKATPGPWFAKKHGCVVGGVERQYTNGKARDQLFMTCGVQEPNKGDQNANAQLIARLSPDTVLAVVEALESCRYNAGENWGAQHRFDEDLVSRALALLNATQPTKEV